jgi:hypothetical protein
MAGQLRETITPLKHADTEWAVRQRVELAPGDMAIRELLQNAIENALLLKRAKDRVIRLRGVDWKAPDGQVVRKLSIWNRGPGMTADKLESSLDLAASGEEKRQGPDANYGVGAKVSGLKASPEGLRYRSCHKGVVSEAVIAKRGDVYGKLRLFIHGVWCSVWDATEACSREGYPLNYDWTEVLLMGTEAFQDTVKSLLPEQDSVWLPQAINRRFYDLSNLDVRREESATDTTDHGRRLLGLGGMALDPSEIVQASFGGREIGIHYGLQSERAGGGTETRLGYTSHACLVYKNECFDYQDAMPWRRVAPRFGIAHGQGRVAIKVLLPDDYPAVFDQYRKNLERPDRTGIIHLEDFQEVVFDSRPQWLLEFIASQAPDQMELSDQLKRRLRDLSEMLRGYKELYRASDEDLDSPPPLSKQSESPDAEREDHGLRPPRERHKRTNVPQHEWVKGGTTEHRGELSQRCARYDRKMHKIFLNEQWEGIERAAEIAVIDFQHAKDQAALRADATALVKEEVLYRATEYVSLALANESFQHWSRADVDAALDCNAISVALCNHRNYAAVVKPRLMARYGKSH